MTSPANRRGFLSGLVSLPLIGGGVMLIGKPVGAAGEPSRLCMESYLAWLHFEKRAVHSALYPEIPRGTFVPQDNKGAQFHFADRFGHHGWWQRVKQEALSRAPVVLATVGCDWREGEPCA